MAFTIRRALSHLGIGAGSPPVPAGSRRDAIRASIGDDWRESEYYDDAEKWLSSFWGDKSVFKPLFARLDLTNVVELACGHGRHAAQCLDRVGRITLIDINAENIDHCRERFGSDGRVAYLVNDGRGFSGIGDSSLTAIYSYDAMVHFELLDVIDYIRDAHRVLRTGGRALFHISNNASNPTASYKEQPGWRNFMSVDIARNVADRTGFECLHHQVFDWAAGAGTDGVVLLEKR